MPSYKRQHVVTKAILRRFTDPNTHQLEVFWKEENDDVRPAGPSQVCYVDFLVRDNPQVIEEVWSKHETELGHFYECLDNGTLLGDEAAVKTARSMLAMHAARSHSYLDVAIKSEAWAREKIRDNLIEEQSDALAEQIRARFAERVEITPELLFEEASAAVERNAHAIAIGGKFFAQRLLNHFNEAQKILATSGPEIEILMPANPQAEFLISDDPVLIPSASGDGRVGIENGVGWLQALTFAMPFSPRHMIAAAGKGLEVSIGDQAVDRMNELQIKRARKHIVTRPGSDLAQWAIENWNDFH